jgi:hypothetical protein
MSWPRYSLPNTSSIPGEMGIPPEQADFDAAELALLAIAEAHRMLLTCGLLRDAAPRGLPAARREVAVSEDDDAYRHDSRRDSSGG